MTNLVTSDVQEVKKVLERYRPFDTTVNVDNLEFGIEEKTPKLKLQSSGMETPMYFRLHDYTFNQFLQLLNYKFNIGQMNELSETTQENVVNDLLASNRKKSWRKKRRQLLFRSEDYTRNDMRTVGILTTDYAIVNHDWLFDFISNAKHIAGLRGEMTEHSKFEVVTNYDFANVRLPLGKIADERLGVYGGIEFTNGQTGKIRLQIKNMIWELICSNGMVDMRQKSMFIDKKHVGHIRKELHDMPIWLNNTYIHSNGLYRQLKDHRVKDLNDTLKKKYVKKYSMITGELAYQMYKYIIENDSRAKATDSASGWEVVRSLTYLSQQRSGYARYDLDNFAFSLAEKEFGLN